MAYYRRRLARVHAQDYTDYARAAGALLRRIAPPGLVVDLGCGAGDLSAELDEPWDYLGIDNSPDMLTLARQRFPGRRFQQGSALDPPPVGAAAVVAIGEVLNYATDAAGLVGWARVARSALGPGGILLVDVAGPLRADPQPRTRVHRGEGYRLEVTVRTDPSRRTLTREIRVSDSEGGDREVHVLNLVDPVEVLAALHAAGFAVTPLTGYGELPFPRGWSGFLGRVILES
jgi:SAM-dependent methyltransferase